MFEMIDFMLLPLLATTGDGPTWVLLGRLHPMLVHFPIAMILVAAAVELFLVVRKQSKPSRIGSFCVAVGTFFACLSVWCGWALGEEHGSGTTLELHRWFGVATAGVLLAVMICWAIERVSAARWSFQSYRFGLWGGAVLMIVTSMFGGDMVWGSDWLTGPLSQPEPQVAPVEIPEETAAPAAMNQNLEVQVAALFTARCESCHGPTKQKADLQLVPLAAAFSMDEDGGGVVVPGEPEESELFKRITLPVDHDDHMPPKGDPLTAEQIDLVREWIDAGAAHGVAMDSSPGEVVSSDTPPSINDPQAFDAGLQAIIDRGGVVTALHGGSAWYEVNVSIAKPAWTDEDLAMLAPVSVNLWSLNAGRSAVTDAGMATVATCVNLRVLKLNSTAVGDAGVEAIEGLQHLQRLNLFGTEVGDKAIDALEKMPALTHVYLWDTKVTRLGLDTLRVARPHIEVDSGAGLSIPTPKPESPPEAPPPAPKPAEPEVPEEPVEDQAATVSLPPCCKAAADEGRECDHACCVEARAKGEICPKCAVEG